MKQSQWSGLLGLVVVSMFFGRHVAMAECGGKGYVDWTGGVVTAIGYGDIPQGEQAGQPNTAAMRAAETAAQRILSETTVGIHVDSATTIADLMRQNDSVRTQVEAVLRSAIVTNREMLVADGSPLAAVEMKICLAGRSPQCAQKPLLMSVIMQEQQVAPPPGQEQQVVQPSGHEMQTAKTPAVIPLPTPAEPSPVSVSSALPLGWKPARYDSSRPATGVIILVVGCSFEKVLLPVVVSGEKTNQIVYSVKSIDPQVVRTHGAVRYAISQEEAQSMELVAGNPVLIKAIGVTKDNQVIIHPQDAAILRDSLRNGNNYLQKAHVVVVN